MTLSGYTEQGVVLAQSGVSVSGVLRGGRPLTTWRPCKPGELAAWGVKDAPGIWACDTSTTRDVEVWSGEQILPLASTNWANVLDSAPGYAGNAKGGLSDTAAFVPAPGTFPTAIPSSVAAWCRVEAWTMEQQFGAGNLVSWPKTGVVVNRWIGQANPFGSNRRNARYRVVNVGWMTPGTAYVAPNAVYVMSGAQAPVDAWLSTCPNPLVTLQGVQDVSLGGTAGLRLLGGLSDGIRALAGCGRITATNLDLIGMAGNGLIVGEFDGGQSCSLVSCDDLRVLGLRARDVGGSAIHAAGGDRKLELPGGPDVRRARITRCGRRRMDATALVLIGQNPTAYDVIAEGCPGRVLMPQHPYGQSDYTGLYGGSNGAVFGRFQVDGSSLQTSDDGTFYMGRNTDSDIRLHDWRVSNATPPKGQGTGQTHWTMYVDDGQTGVSADFVQVEKSFGALSVNGGGNNHFRDVRAVGCQYSASITNTGDPTVTMTGLSAGGAPVIDGSWRPVQSFTSPAITQATGDTGWTVAAPVGVPA